MPSPGDMLPPDRGWIMRELKALRRGFDEFRAARRLESATIGAGGLRIADGGSLSAQTPAGVETVYVGALPPELNHVDGSTQRGMWVRREDGTICLTVSADPSVGGDRQGVSIWDRTGRVVVADDVVSGGLARPWIASSGWYDVTGVDVPTSTTTSSSFAALHEQLLYQQHPKVRVVVRVRCSDGSTAGEIRVMSGGVQVGSTQVIPTGSYGQWEIAGTTQIPVGGSGLLLIQGRRTAGSGTIGARGLITWGVQS